MSAVAVGARRAMAAPLVVLYMVSLRVLYAVLYGMVRCGVVCVYGGVRGVGNGAPRKLRHLSLKGTVAPAP